jgi:hypothetical protein
MSDPFKQLVEQMARLSVPEHDTEKNLGAPRDGRV